MKNFTRCIASSVILIIVLSVSSYGWGPKGHMMVAAIAYDKLQPDVKARVDRLVRLNPYIEIFLDKTPQSTPPAQVNKMLFMVAATWPDIIKSHPDYITDGTHSGNRPPNTPKASQNIGYDDLFRHKYWHFIDIPFGGNLKIPTPNARDRMKVFTAMLANPSTKKKIRLIKSYDLCWLLHLVGDIHQPLHCITRIVPEDQDGDDGGNDVKLSTGKSLHSFWDGIVGGGDAPSTALEAASSLPEPEVTAVNDLSVQHWINESFNLKEFVYSSPIGDGLGPFTMTDAHETKALEIANARIALAGARLAKLLNKNLK
jgi:hypothetical protein